MQYRHGGMDTFFKHDNHTYQPPLSERGKLRQEKKFDLIDIVAPSIQVEFSSTFDVKLIDGDAVVHLPVTSITTFDDQSSTVFLPYNLNNNRHQQKRTLSGTHTWITA